MERILRPRPTEPRAASGFTLIEVVIAMLLTSVMVTAVFSVALTGKSGGKKGDHKLLAAEGVRQVAGQLAKYVSADVTTSPPQILGPGTGGGLASWSMTSSGVMDSCGGCYALAPGLHTLSNLLPSWFEAAPYYASVSYTVANGPGVPPNVLKNVTITARWTEP